MKNNQIIPTDKSLAILLCLVIRVVAVYSQSAPQVIPPSPAASSLQSFGNADVSLYTGAVKTAIPIHTIKLRDLEFPIVLNYSASGGINVQEVASWVGIGWTLNATGAVSRTINGLADDKHNAGYVHIDTIPPMVEGTLFANEKNNRILLNSEVFQNFADGHTDGEPDRYFYNVNGVSGSFYIDKQKQALQVPLTNNKIMPEFDILDKLVAFELVTDGGVVYRFTVLEETRSYMMGGASTDMNYYTSSWHLTSVRNYNDTEAINFHYETYYFDQYSEVFTTLVIENPGNVFVPRYSVTETHAQRLKYITYNESDTIKFITGNVYRKDLWEDKFLSRIEIHEQELNRSVDFAYSYFDKNGVEPLTTTAVASHSYVEGSLINTQSDGDHFKRIKLDTVRFFNSDRSESLPYTFEYYSGAYLPSRFSYARDHWGFYNGKENNPNLEPRRKVDRRPIHSLLRGEDFAIYGEADREPSSVHAKAGMLTKINYPTGGSTAFEYELHQSAMKDLPNLKEHASAILSPLVLKDTMHIETINDPFVELKIKVLGITLGEYCDFQVMIKNLQTSSSTFLSDFNEGDKTVFFLEGDYEVTYTTIDNIGNCFGGENFYNIAFSWENEVVTPNKDVGGLRIKQVTDISGYGDSTRRVYKYLLDDSTLSSGSLATLPQYGFYEQDGNEFEWDPGFFDFVLKSGIVLNYIRTYNTNIPLAQTQGSHVGYRRVEVTTHQPTQTGKSVYYYTCPADHPDFTRGWTIFKYDDEITINGKRQSTFLFPHSDNRDWKRGLLYAKVDYAYQNGEFIRIASKESYYKIRGVEDAEFNFEWQSRHPMLFIQPNLDYSKDKFFEEDETEGAGIPKLLGVRTFCNGEMDGETYGCGKTYVTFYEYYSGRIELVAERENLYQEGSVLSTVKSYKYSNPQYYYPTKIQQSTSLTDSVTTLLKYPFDYASMSGLSTPQQDALEALALRNVLSSPVETTIKRGNTEVERTRTNYQEGDDLIYPENIVSSNAGSSLETEVVFTAYDDDGNILEYSARNGVATSFLYRYENKLPVAQAVNAHHNQILYESFEEDGTIGDAKTGKRYYEGDYTFNLSTAQANSVLSYWYWDVNKWKFKQVSYSPGSHTITDGTRIDEVRVHPAGSTMTTYTYLPGVGINTVTDPNNKTTYYTYDLFGRLMLVKDHLGNILQRTQYYYKGQE